MKFDNIPDGGLSSFAFDCIVHMVKNLAAAFEFVLNR